MNTNLLEPCPFCGTTPDLNDPDTLYPSGVGWKQVDDHVEYCSALEVSPDQWCYSLHCTCGAEMSADSPEDCIIKWNTRVGDNDE